MFLINIDNFKKLKHIFFKKKHQSFVLLTESAAINIKKYLKKKNQLKY